MTVKASLGYVMKLLRSQKWGWSEGNMIPGRVGKMRLEENLSWT